MRNLSCGSCHLHARSMTNFASYPPTGLGCLTTSRSPPSPFAGDAVAIAHHHPSGPPPAPTEQATAPRSVVPPPPPLRAATAPTCHHNSHGHPRGSTTPLTTYHWLWPLPTPQVGVCLCPGGQSTPPPRGDGYGAAPCTWWGAPDIIFPLPSHLPLLNPILQEELPHLLVTLIPA